MKVISASTLERVIPLLFLVGSCAGYFFISRFSHPFLGLIAVYGVQFLCYGWVALRLSHGKGPSIGLIVAVGILCRIILWFSEPVLENDYWRYLWDGRVLAHGINPYLYAPLDPALDFLSTTYRSSIGWPKFGTIYPPFSEIIFAGIHFIAPDSVLALKAVLTAFDLATGFLLIRWLVSRGQDRAWSALYFLNPLVLKEIANSAHLDSIAVFFSMAALYLFIEKPKHRVVSWIMLALSASAKLYPLVLVPLLARLDAKWQRHLWIFAAVFIGLYLPFVGAGTRLFGGTQAYAKYWIFNASIFQVTTLSLNSLLANIPIFQASYWTDVLRNDYPAKLVLGGVFIVSLVRRTRLMNSIEELAGSAFWILGLLLLISPVVDAWYVLWVLPLACLFKSVPWLTFSFLVIASYSWMYSKSAAPFFRVTEYGVFFLMLIGGLPFTHLGVKNRTGSVMKSALLSLIRRFKKTSKD